MAFPTTPILDDFNRADNASNLGTSIWTGDLRSGGGWPVPGIQTNRLYLPSAFKSGYYNVRAFGQYQQAYATIPTVPVGGGNGWVELWIRTTNPGAGSLGGFFVRISSGANVYPGKYVLGAETILSGSVATAANGDQFGVEAIGTTFRVYQNGTEVYSTTDTSNQQGGYVGFAAGDPTSFTMDDFGGGDIPGPPRAKTRFIYMRRR